VTLAEGEVLGIAYICHVGGCKNVPIYFSPDNIRFDVVMEMDRHMDKSHPDRMEDLKK